MSRILHRAPWVVPVNQTIDEVIEDGIVLCEGNRIVKVGSYKDLQSEGGELREHDGIIAPALINAHTHLELSGIKDLGREGQEHGGDMTSWIRSLLAKRQELVESEQTQSSSLQVLDSLYLNGCAVVLDIGNQQDSRALGLNHKISVRFFLEVLGISKTAQDAAISALKRLPPDLPATAHAPYSTGKNLIQALKRRNSANGWIFPMHVAESAEEVVFMQNGRGKFREFLEERGVWDENFQAPRTGVIQYLDNLGVLDNKTICVHAVHVTVEEIALLAARGAKVCLCPGSNRYLGVGKAPVKKYLANRILPALGTDSAASNPCLNIWREMRLLFEDNPDIHPAVFFAMATLGGAQALGMETEMGGLSAGKRKLMLGIGCPAMKKKDVFEYLTTAGENAPVAWL